MERPGRGCGRRRGRASGGCPALGRGALFVTPSMLRPRRAGRAARSGPVAAGGCGGVRDFRRGCRLVCCAMTTTEAGSEASVPSARGGGGDAGDVVVVGSLSPSRAGDFMTCPLLYRFRVIDRIPERPSAAAVRGRWCTRCWSGCSICRRAGGRRLAALELLGPEWSGCWRRSRSSRGCSRTGTPGTRSGRSGWGRRGGWWSGTSAGGSAAAGSRSGSCSWRRCWIRG